MYSPEQRVRAAELYIKYGLKAAATIRVIWQADLRHRVDRPSESRDDVPRRHGLRGSALSRTTRRTYAVKSEMAVALDVVRGERTLSQVAAEHGVSPSLASEWRDELLGGQRRVREDPAGTREEEVGGGRAEEVRRGGT